MSGFPAPPGQGYGADYAKLLRRVQALEAQIAHLTTGPVACTSTTHPASPNVGAQIYETDTGLTAWWNGSVWVYPPQRIRQQVITSTTASITFSSIPQVFTNLELIVVGRSDGTGASGYDGAGLTFNGVSSGYNGISIFSTQGAGTVSTSSATAQTSIGCAHFWNAHFGTAGWGIARISVPGYSATTGTKGLVSHGTASDSSSAGIERYYSGFSGITGAITSLTLAMAVGNFTQATLSLYGS